MLLALALVAGCARPDVETPTAEPEDLGSHGDALTLQDNITRLGSQPGNYGVDLQRKVMERAAGIAPWNRPYVFDGYQDCWGFVRQTWNAILYDGSPHPEDYYPNAYDVHRWVNTVSGGLLTADAPNPDWKPIPSWSALLPGDLLSTDQGHAWGDQWHGGIFAGVGSDGRYYDYDNSSTMNGAYYRAVYTGFKYYYQPIHDLLAKQAAVTLARPGVGFNADGRMELFARGRDGAIYHAYQTSPNGSWSPWYSLGGNLAGNPVIGRTGDGKLAVFARGPSNDLWFVAQAFPNGSWTGWSSLGGATAFDPAVGTQQDGRLMVVVRGSNGNAYARTQNADGTFAPWVALGGALSGKPTLENRQDGGLELFARKDTGEPMHAWQLSPNSGSWSGWYGFGGGMKGDAVTKLHADGKIYMFVRGGNDALYYVNQTAPNSGWGGWVSLDGAISSEPAVGINSDGSLTVLARGQDNGIWFRRLGAYGWSGWATLGGVITSAPAVGRSADGRLFVFGRGDTGLLYMRFQDAPGSGSWSGWQVVGDSVSRF